MQKEIIINEFLAKNNFPHDNKEKLAQDASSREYYRFKKNKKSYLIMDVQNDFDCFHNFIMVTNFLRKNSFSTPEIFAYDDKNGLMIIEDFGDNSFNHVMYNETEIEETLYKNAIDNLVKLHHISPPDFLQDHSKETLLKGIEIFCDQQIGDGINHKKCIKLWQEILSKLSDNKVIVLRDFHADNLFWLNKREGNKKTGLIDFQDASIGNPAYDLASLLEDARHYIRPQFRDDMIEYYLEQNKKINREQFLQDYAILSTQRNLRVLGLFTKLVQEDKKVRYQKYLPTVRQYIRCNIQNKFLISFMGKNELMIA